MDIKGKSGGEGSAERSRNPRDPRAGLADAAEMAKSPTTMWELLVWAYQREMVRFCAGSVDAGPTQSHHSQTARAMANEFGVGMQDRSNGHYFAPAAHEDALGVHGIVVGLDAADRTLLIRTAEKGAPPEWNPSLPPARLVPVRRSNGKPETVYCGRGKRAVACRVRQVGYTEMEIRRITKEARDSYSRWHKLLTWLALDLQASRCLSCWRIVDIGADPQPWGSTENR